MGSGIVDISPRNPNNPMHMIGHDHMPNSILRIPYAAGWTTNHEPRAPAQAGTDHRLRNAVCPVTVSPCHVLRQMARATSFRTPYCWSARSCCSPGGSDHGLGWGGRAIIRGFLAALRQEARGRRRVTRLLPRLTPAPPTARKPPRALRLTVAPYG